MTGQHPDDVVTLASAQADQPDRPGRGPVKRLPQVHADSLQSRAER